MNTNKRNSYCRASAKVLTDKQLGDCIAHAEQQARVMDAAEGRQWFAKMRERDADYMWLMALREEQEDRAQRVAA